MFSVQNLALGGFYPGLVTSMSIANIGIFDVEVIIQPVVSGGGGYVPSRRNEKPERYRVTVRVIHNGKVYEESIVVDDHAARVSAKTNGIMIFSEDTAMVSLNGIQIMEAEQIEIRAKIKDPK